MSTSLLLEAEAKLTTDSDGSYKAQLIALVEKHRDEFAFARQGFLPPDEYEVAVQMESAVEAALAIIRDYEPPLKDDGTPADDQAGGVMNTMVDI